jgi:hypothetical protein
MFKTLFISSFLLASVYCDPTDFEDKEALQLALENSGALLEPPKEVYNKIHKDLAAIRLRFPIVTPVKHLPDFAVGKIVCQKFAKESATKLNDSEFGPIKENRNETTDSDEITFEKPYNSPALIKVLEDKKLVTDCDVEKVHPSTHITVGLDSHYTFQKGSGICGPGCHSLSVRKWTFAVHHEEVVLVSDSHTGF